MRPRNSFVDSKASPLAHLEHTRSISRTYTRTYCMWGPQRTEKQSGVLTPWVSIPVQRGSSGKEKRKRKRKWKKKLKKEKRGRGGERRDACVESRSQSYPKRIFEEDPIYYVNLNILPPISIYTHISKPGLLWRSWGTRPALPLPY